ncbi:DHA2 family efflux MFS transporter permease subunit [Mucilaginibacter sp. X4EP1]|uniref:DHA2 family efflux MFS transporter permease subunit n=1 Tax=Mucilaginibacter sp. X4EP1 TaxID=2723092 RepID=UPI0021687D76|nr:DHA2 family efflux MFS transporter permease subunit [Mucilaginibacter sp. X4EP1]MCS3815705.1 DHA2 family multidrug resistance protein [Mucilaginibacter sp. X4EP1]
MTGLKRQLLIITVLLAAVMELIDTTIVNVALSHMSGNLGATIEDTTWVITAYAIANVIIIPLTSFLTIKLGRRNYYIGSIILFVVCSFMCGSATDIWTLVFFRFLQGLGGGALLSVSQAVIFELFPKEKQGVASAIFGIGVFIGPTIGPTMGGIITENYSWPLIFYINIPIGILAATSCYFLLTEPLIKSKVHRVDWTGIALLAIGIGSLQTVLERGQTEDWFATGYITFLTVTSVITLTSFILWELHVENPVVNLRVFKSKTLSIAALLTFITGIGMFTSIFLTPVIAQRLLGFTPTQTGLLLLPGAIIAILGLMVSGKLLQAGVSPLIIITIGFVCFIYFNWSMFGMDLDTSANTITRNLIFRALGMAFLTVPLTMLAISTLAPKDIPQGAALNNMMRQLGGSFGISIINTYSARRIASHRMDLISHITSSNPLTIDRINSYTAYFQHKGSNLIESKQKAMGLIELGVVKQSTLLSYTDAFFLIGILFAITLPLLLFVVGGTKKTVPKMVISDH